MDSRGDEGREHHSPGDSDGRAGPSRPGSPNSSGGGFGGVGGPGPSSGQSDDQLLAIACHLGGLVLSVLAPLIVYLVKRDESAFVRHHATEALNFQITVLIAGVVAGVLFVVLIGVPLLLLVVVLDLVFCILAALAANRGEWYRYPVSIRVVT